MISRRTILAWLGLAPAAAALASNGLPPIVEAAKRVRAGWHVKLEADGSSVLMNEGKRFLEEWAASGDFEKWNKGKSRLFNGIGDYVGDVEYDVDFEVDAIKQTIQEDIAAVDVRSNPWRQVEEIAARQGCEPPKLEGVVYEPGTWFEQDLGDLPHAIEAMKAKGIKVEKRYIVERDWWMVERERAHLEECKAQRGIPLQPCPIQGVGHSKADYWETWAWCNGRQPTQAEIEEKDRLCGDSYWAEIPLSPDFESYRELRAL